MTSAEKIIHEYEFKIDFCDLAEGDLDFAEISSDALTDQLGFDKVAKILEDKTEEAKIEKFLTFWGTFARVGNQLYVNSDGSIRVENRSEEEVIKSLDSFRNKAITLNHPDELVLANNSKQYTVGLSHEDVDYDRGLARIRITLIDQEAINAIKKTHRQLSAGYLARVVPKKDTWFGDPYTHQQRDIYGNHIALVEKGRAGDLVISHINSRITVGDNFPENSIERSQVIPWSVQIYHNNSDSKLEENFTNSQDRQTNNQEESQDMTTEKDKGKNVDTEPASTNIASLNFATLNIDGISLQMSESAAVAINSKIKALEAANEKLTTDSQATQQELEAANGKLKVQDAEIEMLKTKLQEQEQKIADSQPSLQTMRQVIDARLALEKEAIKVLGNNTKLDSLSDREVKCAVLAAIYKDRLKFDASESDGVVNAAYQAAILLHSSTASPNAKGKEATFDAYQIPYATDSNDDEEAIQERQRKKYADAATSNLSGNISNFK